MLPHWGCGDELCIYRWTVEALYNLGSLFNGHGAIQADIQVPKGKSKDQNLRRMQSSLEPELLKGVN